MNDITAPFINISIPGPFIVIGILPLTLLYIAIIGLDYYLCCRTLIPYEKYKHGFCLFHLLIPFLFAPKLHQFSTAFQTFPWFFASVGAYCSQLYKHQQLKLNGPPQSFKGYLLSIAIEGFAQPPDRQPNDKTLTKEQVRIEGLRRLLNNIIVMALASKLLTPLLLDDPKTLFSFPWYSLQCMWFGFLMGLKGYTLMMCMDGILSIAQILTGLRMLHLFDVPFLASSPKDFWGKRWNLIVRNLFRKQLYQKETTQSASKRFYAFFISSVMHEAVMILANRNITCEQLAFFLIHGLIVYIQTILPDVKVPKVISVVLTMMLFSCTSKLFLGPFLRYEEQCVLFGRHSYI